MVRSSEIDDCTMLFLCSLLLGRGRGIIFKPSRSGYPFFLHLSLPYNKKEEVEKPPLCDSLGNMHLNRVLILLNA